LRVFDCAKAEGAEKDAPTANVAIAAQVAARNLNCIIGHVPSIQRVSDSVICFATRRKAGRGNCQRKSWLVKPPGR
jgi:hypothetical protein